MSKQTPPQIPIAAENLAHAWQGRAQDAVLVCMSCQNWQIDLHPRGIERDGTVTNLKVGA